MLIANPSASPFLVKAQNRILEIIRLDPKWLDSIYSLLFFSAKADNCRGYNKNGILNFNDFNALSLIIDKEFFLKFYKTINGCRGYDIHSYGMLNLTILMNYL
jgi:hypothetical protein